MRGLPLPEADRFATPLGEWHRPGRGPPLGGMKQVSVSGAAHAPEHRWKFSSPSCSASGDFTSGSAGGRRRQLEEVAEVLDALWGGPETLIVISSDLSHYLPYAAAKN